MKIVLVSAFYSEGMGYSENCLPKALASLGHDVHVITSNLNVYGNLPDYNKTYESFLGSADQGIGEFEIDGYTVHRLPATLLMGYVYIKTMYKKLMAISPDVVQVTEIASLNTFNLVLLKPFIKFSLFTETHQHLSVVKPYVKNKKGYFVKRLAYYLTRTLPSAIASLFVEKCYAISPDCADVAHEFYGVPRRKLKIQPLGTDTDLFHPAVSEEEMKSREELRSQLGYSGKDIVCIYSGRFSNDKNPLLVAESVEKLAGEGLPFHALFIGEGTQGGQIHNCHNAQVLSFMKHHMLAEYYRIADIAVWPTQESISMLDAAASALPLVVSDQIGEIDRVDGNGRTFKEGEINDLCKVLHELGDELTRTTLGKIGRKKMDKSYSWNNIAISVTKDYRDSLKKNS
jgi:glycosyltransferase involved in cell wall biosynthesis